MIIAKQNNTIFVQFIILISYSRKNVFKDNNYFNLIQKKIILIIINPNN